MALLRVQALLPYLPLQEWVNMLFYKDNKDDYYQFADNVPPVWHANLTLCSQQVEALPTLK